MGVAAGSKVVKKVSAPKTAKTSTLSHPPYIQMITEALVALKERTGSSHHAIAKHIEEEQKIKDLPANFRKQLSIQLKKFVASGKLVMVKKSFKLPPKSSTTSKTAEKSKTVEKKKVKKPAGTTTTATKVVKPKAVAAKKAESKSKSLKAVKSPMKKKAPAVAKAKKPKSIKSPVKKTVVKKAVAAAAKKAGKK